MAAVNQRTIDDLLVEPDSNIVVRCRACRRPSRNPKARAAGIGKTCLKKERQPDART